MNEYHSTRWDTIPSGHWRVIYLGEVYIQYGGIGDNKRHNYVKAAVPSALSGSTRAAPPPVCGISARK